MDLLTTINKTVSNIINVREKYSIVYGKYAIQGKREYMEDEINIVRLYLTYFDVCYVVILCDGHAGGKCSKYVVSELPIYLQDVLQDVTSSDDIIKILKNTIQLLDTNYKKFNDYSGTTCIFGLFLDSNLHIVNIGDSRGIIGNHMNQVKLATIDHKPSLNKEYTRIIKFGGAIINQDVPRVYAALVQGKTAP